MTKKKLICGYFKVFLVYAGLFFADSLELSLFHFSAFLSLHNTAVLALHVHGLLIQTWPIVTCWSFLPDPWPSDSIRFFRIYSLYLYPSFLVPLKPMTIWSTPSWTSQMTHVMCTYDIARRVSWSLQQAGIAAQESWQQDSRGSATMFLNKFNWWSCLVEFADNLRFPLAFSWTSWRSRSVFPDRCARRF